jgi:hypothetical protein
MAAMVARFFGGRARTAFRCVVLLAPDFPKIAQCFGPIHAEERCGASIFLFCAGKDLHECVE